MTGDRRPSRLRQVVFRILPSLIVLTLLVASEGALRLWAQNQARQQRGRSLPSPAERNAYQREDDVLGYALMPGYAAGGIRVNQAGYRGPELQLLDARRTLRLVAIGDSTTFGLAGEDCPYPAQLQRLLNARPGQHRTAEVINAGVEGYGSQRGLRLLQTRIGELRPEVVTLYIGWNDIYASDPARANLPPLHGAAQPAGPARSVSRWDAAARSFDRLYLIKALRRLLRLDLPRLRARLRGIEGLDTTSTEGIDPQTGELYRWRLEQMIHEARQLQAEPVLMTLPTVLSREPTARGLEIVHYPTWAGGDYGLFFAVVELYNQMIRDVAEATGTVLIDNAAHFDAMGSEKEAYFFDSVHLYCDGNALIARNMADVLTRQMLLPSASGGS